MIIYGFITEESVTKLFVAGIGPGLLLVVMAPRPDQKERVDDSPKNFWNKNLAHEDEEVGELPDDIYARSPQASSGEIQSLLENLLRAAPGRVWLGVSMPHKGDDRRRLREWQRVATAAGAPLLATNDVLYHDAERRELQDVVTCIREHVTLNEAGRRLEANAERHLKSPGEMAELFHEAPDAAAQFQPRSLQFHRSRRTTRNLFVVNHELA